MDSAPDASQQSAAGSRSAAIGRSIPYFRPKASVVVVNYNGGASLERCLTSLGTGGCCDSEVILVDNASTDDSADQVEQQFPWVNLVRSHVNAGFGQGNNLGARLARGEYLAFLNPDTLVDQSWLQCLVAALEADPSAGLATSKLALLAQPETVNACGNEIHFTGLTLCRGLGARVSSFTQREEVAAVSGAAFGVRHDLFDALGGFDSSFFLYLEDTDLSLRARLAGCSCILAPASLVYHDYELTFDPLKVFCLERNRYLLLLKCWRWRTLLLLLPALLLAELVSWGFLLVHNPRWWTSKLRAYVWVVTHWASIMASRAQTQALRQVGDRALLAVCTDRLDFAQTNSGIASSCAQAVFNPLFHLFYGVTLALVRW